MKLPLVGIWFGMTVVALPAQGFETGSYFYKQGVSVDIVNFARRGSLGPEFQLRMQSAQGRSQLSLCIARGMQVTANYRQSSFPRSGRMQLKYNAHFNACSDYRLPKAPPMPFDITEWSQAIRY